MSARPDGEDDRGNVEGAGQNVAIDDIAEEQHPNLENLILEQDNGEDNENNNVNPEAVDNGDAVRIIGHHDLAIVDNEDDEEHENPYYHRIIVDSDEDGDMDSSDTEPDVDRADEDGTMDIRHERSSARGASQFFDHELPGRHNYLGEGMEELQGRVVWDDDEVMTREIPIIVMSLTLIPGQTLPLTTFHSAFQNAIRRCVAKDRMFGIVQMDTENFPGQTVSRGTLGTLAEIYEFQEESDVEFPFDEQRVQNSFAIKAKGRSRFLVLSVRRQGDGNLMGKVRILPEIRLGNILRHIPSNGTSRYVFPVHELEPPLPDKSSTPSSSTSFFRRNRRRESVQSQGSEMQMDPDVATLQKNCVQRARHMNRYCAAFTQMPSFVYDQYNDKILVEKLHRKLHELKGLMASGGIIPTDPTDLSFWIVQNLTMEDSLRRVILRMNNAVERLQYELMILERLCPVITCHNCRSKIANRSDIFAMAVEGPTGNYVNLHGIVHETLTLYQVEGVVAVGPPSTEASWFPGYSWTILNCRTCRKHLGWKFKAVGGRLKPKKFVGLTRKSVRHDFESITDEGNI